MREGRAEGYGVAPRAAARRAAQVKAVTRSQDTPERPMAWVVLCGVVAVGALVYLIWNLAEYWAGRPAADLVGFIVAGAIYGSSVWGFCYGWELYDVRKATRLAVILGVFGLAALIIGALLLVAMADSSDGDVDLGDVGKALGGAGRAAVPSAGDVASSVAPMVTEAFAEEALARDEAVEQHQGPQTRPQDAAALASALAAAAPAQTPDASMPPAESGPTGHACRTCGTPFDPGGRLGCPACGSPV